MEKSLSPRDAAERLGVSIDTLRRWEKQGLLLCERTPGGIRRFREEDIAAMLNNLPNRRPATRLLSQLGDSENTEAMDPAEQTRSKAPDMPRWERRVREEQANLEVTKIRREREAIVRVESEQREARQREADERKRESARRQALAERKAEADAAESRRLETLRQTGRFMALLAPTEYEARVARDLAKSVNSDSYPASMPYYTAYAQLEARVTELLQPWRDAQERERARVADQSKIEQLIRSGRFHALTETKGWDRKLADRANREVERALREETDADWTQDDVTDLVDDVLDEWDDD